MPYQTFHRFPMKIVEGRCASVETLVCKNSVYYLEVSANLLSLGSLVRIQGYHVHLEQVSVTIDHSVVVALSTEEPEEF